KLHWTEWNAGLVVPGRRDLPIATREERQPTQAVVEGEIEHQPLGEARTLAGIVEPRAVDQRGAHRPWEDAAWMDWDPGEEHDGTDAGDRDFLFGALVHELGGALRHEDGPSTLAIAWRRWLAARPRWLRAPLAAVSSPARALARRPVIADAQVALNGAGHHLLQHLASRLWGRDDLLTARAYPPELARRSAEIARLLEGEGAGAAAVGPAEAARLRRRMRWMAGFALHERDWVGAPRRWRRRAALAGVALAVLAGFAALAARSIDYHATYVERMNERMDGHGQGH
ncbi:MAG TPA: hypothetical protein VKB80_29115, partial [Kofleriaceae bacterium]|nr:hypothetical protein [Kofleriaceae bacterium]